MQKNGFSEINKSIDRIKSISSNIYQRTIVIIVVLVVWEIAPRLNLIDPVFIPPPSTIAYAFIKLIISGELIRAIIISMSRAICGFGIAMILAIPLGFFMGWFKKFEKYMDPLFSTLRQVNTMTILPLFILLLGIGEASKIAIIAYASFWSTFLNTASAVRNVDPLYIKCAKSIKLSNGKIFRKVVLPSSIPSIFTGLRYSASVSLILLVTSEMLGATNGLGYAINNWQMLFQTDNMWAGIVTMALIGLIINNIFVWIEKRLTHWKYV
ncbi:ABC transporter permease [Clostridium sp. WLY-B-L2]|mgnify:CR=1 FL=1|uniref:ABC transporter permease n=1 Tax=Clostridium aromativorans TaxID=2836848 RepID=A0ABS8N5U5_9CLOT|nr:ABC transporter permease [Clostridium aromativorans]MCC9295181.1 ABC transporter permease [Clostridium aromativorans]